MKTSIYNRVVLATLLFAILPGCKDWSSKSDLDGLTFNSSSKNIAMVFGASNGLPGIDIDLRVMEEVLSDKTANYNFEIVKELEATPESMIAKTKQYATQVGDDGTLFWYFSGHGGWGTLMAENGNIRFATIAKAIKEVRTKPLKRLVVVIDTCNNGNLTNTIANENSTVGFSLAASGEMNHEAIAAAMADEIVEAFGDNAMAPASANGEKYSTQQLYEELLVITASSETQTSNATSIGSVFTLAFADAFKKHRDSGTINDLFSDAKATTQREGGHTPQVRAVPSTVLSLPVVTTGSQQQPQVNQQLPINISLGANDAAGNPQLLVAVPANSTRVILCRKTASECLANPQIDMSLSKTGQIGERLLFGSVGSVVPGAALTLLVTGPDGVTMTHSRSFGIVPRS